MARTGRPKTELVLTDDERITLERLATRRKSAQAIALRARIVLACATGVSNREAARHLGVGEATVGKWRRRFVAKGLNGLFDEDRPGHPRTTGPRTPPSSARSTRWRGDTDRGGLCGRNHDRHGPHQRKHPDRAHNPAVHLMPVMRNSA
jgi:Winged helix-turn helix